MASQDFDARTQAFLSWFTALPGATFHPSIQITDLRPRNAGRGIVATADIPAETTLFTIPRPSIISTSTSPLPQLLPSIFTPQDADPDSLTGADEDGVEDPTNNQDSWTRLILCLLYEQFQGARSKWRPYLDILPERFNTPMFWSGEEIAELQASSVVQRIGRDEADEMIAAKIVPVVRANEAVFFPDGKVLGDEELVELARRMGSTIMAYAFDLEKEEDEEPPEGEEEDEWVEDREEKTELGMVPMADVLNADAEFNAHINHGEDALTAVSLREIKAGEEVLNYYGPLANGELLRRYGYVTPKHARWDVVELSWDLVSAALREVLDVDDATWGKALEKIDDEEIEDGFVIEWGSEEPDSEGRVSANVEFHGLPEELGEQVKAFLKVLKKVDGRMAQRLESSDRRKEVYLRSVLRALEARTAQYPTTLDADLHLQRAQRPEGSKGMALTVRIGEKNLLREAAKWISSELATLDQDVVMTDEPSAKRQRQR